MACWGVGCVRNPKSEVDMLVVVRWRRWFRQAPRVLLQGFTAPCHAYRALSTLIQRGLLLRHDDKLMSWSVRSIVPCGPQSISCGGASAQSGTDVIIPTNATRISYAMSMLRFREEEDNLLCGNSPQFRIDFTTATEPLCCLGCNLRNHFERQAYVHAFITN